MSSTLLSLRSGVHVRTNDDGRQELVTPYVTRSFGTLEPAVAAALRRLDGNPVDIRALQDELLDDPDLTVAARRAAQLHRLVDVLGPVLESYVVVDGTPLISAIRMVDDAIGDPADLPAHAWLRASRFAVSRAIAGATVLESPTSVWRVTIRDSRIAVLLTDLATPARLSDVATDITTPVLRALAGYGLIAVDAAHPDGPAGFAEDEGVRAQWSPADMMVHARSRVGRHDLPYGGTFRYLGTDVAPLPAVRPSYVGREVALYRPTRIAITDSEPTFTEILESRQSFRAYGPVGPDVNQLGEFLFRAARTRSRYGPLPERGMPYEAADRPYPSGGGMQDLEIYVTANRVRGLDRAVYHYDAWRHVLVEVNPDPSIVDQLLAMAAVSKGGSQPDVLLTITSRFSRLAWKYEQIAYATTLRNVGALYQTFYLVATALGLAPCGLGGGDSELVARAIGSDPFEEGAVGDFCIGSLPSSESLATEREFAVSNQPQWVGGQAPEWCQIRSRIVRGYRADTPALRDK